MGEKVGPAYSRLNHRAAMRVVDGNKRGPVRLLRFMVDQASRRLAIEGMPARRHPRG